MDWGMVIGQLVSTAIFVGGMWLVFDRKRMQKLPEHLVPALDIFASRVVRAVEQIYTHNPSKKDLAIGFVIDQYKEYDLPAPSKAAIGLAIEAAVLSLPLKE